MPTTFIEYDEAMGELLDTIAELIEAFEARMRQENREYFSAHLSDIMDIVRDCQFERSMPEEE